MPIMNVRRTVYAGGKQYVGTVFLLIIGVAGRIPLSERVLWGFTSACIRRCKTGQPVFQGRPLRLYPVPLIPCFLWVARSFRWIWAYAAG